MGPCVVLGEELDPPIRAPGGCLGIDWEATFGSLRTEFGGPDALHCVALMISRSDESDESGALSAAGGLGALELEEPPARLIHFCRGPCGKFSTGF